MSMNFGYVVAMEKLMDIKVNEKVEHIRVVMAELQRIASHLLCTGVFGLDLVHSHLFCGLFAIEKEY